MLVTRIVQIFNTIGRKFKRIVTGIVIIVTRSMRIVARVVRIVIG